MLRTLHGSSFDFETKKNSNFLPPAGYPFLPPPPTDTKRVHTKMCLKKCQLLIKPGRYRDIIRIHSRNKSPGCKRQTAVKRRRKPTVLFIADQPNPHIFFTILRQPLVKRLLRSVLTNNQFKIRKRLPQDGINRTCSLYVLFINTSPLKRIVPAYGISCHFHKKYFICTSPQFLLYYYHSCKK